MIRKRSGIGEGSAMACLLSLIRFLRTITAGNFFSRRVLEMEGSESFSVTGFGQFDPEGAPSAGRGFDPCASAELDRDLGHGGQADTRTGNRP